MQNNARVLLIFALATVFVGLYGGVGALQVEAELHTLELGLDALVPFSPVWVLAYLALFPVVLSPLAVLDDARVAYRGALGFGIIVLSGLPFWLFWPVTVPREPVPVVDLFTWGVNLTRWIDPPTNCFPSMHVAEAFFSSLLMLRLDRRVGTLLLGCAVAIWYSTVALDQHWVIDGAVGLAIALAVDQVVYRGLPAEAFRPRSGRWHLAWVALYGVLFLLAASPWWFDLVDPQSLSGRWGPE